jgi:hypothetical protein
MRSNPFLPLFLAVLFIASPGLARSQVQPSAFRNTLPFSIGVGASNFDVDWDNSRMYAATLWADWHPARIPSMLRGLGVEIEAHDLNYGRPATVPSNFRQDTALGGAIYTLPRYRNFRPYGKALFGYGSFDFQTTNPRYSHDTRDLSELGGGFDVRAWHHVFVRADYGYQVWQPLFSNTRRPDPQGVSLGVLYDFRILRHR